MISLRFRLISSCCQQKIECMDRCPMVVPGCIVRSLQILIIDSVLLEGKITLAYEVFGILKSIRLFKDFRGFKVILISEEFWDLQNNYLLWLWYIGYKTMCKIFQWFAPCCLRSWPQPHMQFRNKN